MTWANHLSVLFLFTLFILYRANPFNNYFAHFGAYFNLCKVYRTLRES
jgi:hypothetical protein